jgi:hypothetical protein
MAESEDIVNVVLAILLLHEDEEKSRKNRQCWVRSWISLRKERGYYHQLIPELRATDTKAYQEFMRMDHFHFQLLVDELSPRIYKQDTIMRESIKPAEMCCLAIRYLATGESFRSLEYQFRISRHTISRIVIEVCQAIFEILGHKYLLVPNGREAWKKISNKFQFRWNMPNLLGAVDGKRILLQQPDNSGSHFYDYKGITYI